VTTEQKTAARRLLGYGFLILFFELALIRFIPADVRYTAYFINLVLIAAFLGTGLGLMLEVRRWNITFLFAPLLLALIAACNYFANVIVEAPSMGEEYLWGIYEDISPAGRQWGVTPTVGLFFLLAALMFVPLGQAVGREFGKLPPLAAYGINILGNILGLAAFAAMSYWSTPPLTWFLLGGICFFALCRGKREWAVSLVCFPAVLFMAYRMFLPGHEVWSPYYKINFFQKPHAVFLNVNGSLHQLILDFSAKSVASNRYTAKTREDFLRPYRFVKHPDQVLILGAGTGNDVVMALEQNARHIDAVEIDPQIIRLGRELHFQKPYDDPRVTVYVDDARAFLKSTDRKYDLILLGTLDSQTLLSGMTSLRLDNYVYTVESFQSMREHLKPGGVLILYHMSPSFYIAYRIYAALYRVFDDPPLVHFQKPHRLFNYTLVAGPRRPDAAGEFFTVPVKKNPETGELLFPYPAATDDWPYLYLKEPAIPGHYLQVGGWIAVFSFVLVALALGRENRGKPDGSLFFLGAGFLLLETKSVTEMSLLFGSTWQVNVLVFLSVLLIVLAANLAVLRFPGVNRNTVFLALFASIVLGYGVPMQSLLVLPAASQWLVGGGLAALPLFFAGLAFAAIFQSRAQPVKSLGYNLVGAILGGLLEYSSMATGIKQLYVLALLMYFLAYFCLNRESPQLHAAKGGLL